ncbi:Protein of unknown function (DUF2630) [Streptoalloteichus tenebrarius]|uniref:DUF2630 family protein n=1 Tax=Streptoalloteichus tenebrarius (strain ATCC 17920 / DSM 40477 / JCM 4838 / CBS 697.72 / NBRC 16177 / NCIMB 11028 / NRRL B-12390 / A12253. 1 / ISP 5477) TaxID=1933 RepID=A0ABT1HXY1_STRSD|nr:DUF2630 family protein [Streptoalloteichus tenebrarius]MCP2260383.1 Protein of unknown function (DUF2630) [Streptoalloteichus tenebrarius]BFF02509.1 DUF2630 family protein [Streptoalloteichus tenebrarius]
MTDDDVMNRIQRLVEEEHRLRERAVGEGVSEEENTRLRSLEEALDQCWDLLRQRRARRDTGQNPDEARPRPPSEVEGYLQ